jgi:hypothetical protein
MRFGSPIEESPSGSFRRTSPSKPSKKCRRVRTMPSGGSCLIRRNRACPPRVNCSPNLADEVLLRRQFHSPTLVEDGPQLAFSHEEDVFCIYFALTIVWAAAPLVLFFSKPGAALHLSVFDDHPFLQVALFFLSVFNAILAPYAAALAIWWIPAARESLRWRCNLEEIKAAKRVEVQSEKKKPGFWPPGWFIYPF